MMKRLLCLLAVLVLLPVIPAMAESEASALEMGELLAWVEGYKTMAMSTQPLNDPTEPEAFSEDGYAFIYEFGTLYMDRPEMTEESVVRNLVVIDPAQPGIRGVTVDMFTEDVLEAYYNENPTLKGDRGFAVLYVSDMLPTGALWAWVQRDGQRIQAVQYAVHDQLPAGGDGYTDAGLVYTIQDNIVVAIRAYGLDAVIAEEDVRANVTAVEQVMEEDFYQQVPVSYMGTDLDMFAEADLSFGGIDFLTVTPEEAVQALGQCREDTWMEDDTGEFIRTMEFAECEMTFIYDADKQNPCVDTLSILVDGMEGPRCVRIGDVFSSVLTRFRYNEGGYQDAVEVLYGSVGSAPYGVADYGAGASPTLRYALRAQDGREVVMYMSFNNMLLTEILLYVND